jgi:hypothetical protein
MIQEVKSKPKLKFFIRMVVNIPHIPDPHHEHHEHHHGHHELHPDLHHAIPWLLLLMAPLYLGMIIKSWPWSTLVLLVPVLLVPLYNHLPYDTVLTQVGIMALTCAIIFVFIYFMWKWEAFISLENAYMNISITSAVFLVISFVAMFVYFMFYHELWAKIGLPIALIILSIGFYLSLKNTKVKFGHDKTGAIVRQKLDYQGRLFGFTCNLIGFTILISALYESLMYAHYFHHHHREWLAALIVDGALAVVVFVVCMWNHLQLQKKKKKKTPTDEEKDE